MVVMLDFMLKMVVLMVSKAAAEIVTSPSTQRPMHPMIQAQDQDQRPSHLLVVSKTLPESDSVPCKSKAASDNAGGSNPAASRNRPAVNSAGRPNPAGWFEKGQHLFSQCWVILVQGGIVKFGGGDGRITGKGTIRTSELDFENVYYVEELQHFNLFSVYSEFLGKFDTLTPSAISNYKRNNVTCLVAKHPWKNPPMHRRKAHVKLPNNQQIGHLKPFGCQVTILNTSDHLGKFEGKADDGYTRNKHNAGPSSSNVLVDMKFNADNANDLAKPSKTRK
ncbi:hypothetical protein Tco_0271166 [Tanacetum coccineum]